MVAKSTALSGERKALENFCRSLIMRTSRSASLLEKGSAGPCRNRSVLLAGRKAQQQVVSGSAPPRGLAVLLQIVLKRLHSRSCAKTLNQITKWAANLGPSGADRDPIQKTFLRYFRALCRSV